MVVMISMVTMVILMMISMVMVLIIMGTAINTFFSGQSNEIVACRGSAGYNACEHVRYLKRWLMGRVITPGHQRFGGDHSSSQFSSLTGGHKTRRKAKQILRITGAIRQRGTAF
jgi:hypothetical protein